MEVKSRRAPQGTENGGLTPNLVPSFYHPDYPILTGSVGQAAVNGQIITYPKVVRKEKDPEDPDGFTHHIMTFNLYTEPKVLRDGSKIYGMYKIRGCKKSVEECTARAEEIVLKVDSKNMNRIVPNGYWAPITESSMVIQDKKDVGEQQSMYGDAVRAAQEKEYQAMKELRDREEKLRDDKLDPYHNKEAIEFYIMERVVDNNLTKEINKYRTILDSLTAKRRLAWRVIKKIESIHPEYREEWLDVYNKERENRKIAPYVPSEKAYAELESTVFDDLEEHTVEQLHEELRTYQD